LVAGASEWRNSPKVACTNDRILRDIAAYNMKITFLWEVGTGRCMNNIKLKSYSGRLKYGKPSMGGLSHLSTLLLLFWRVDVHLCERKKGF
jgi:hypothetical protein